MAIIDDPFAALKLDGFDRPEDYPEHLGAPIFPCRPWPDKSPITRHGFKDATTDLRVIRRWWRDNPDALIAMPTGEVSGFNIFDLDCKPERNGFKSQSELGFELEPTWISMTPGGGFHHWFLAIDRRLPCSRDKLGPGIDVRGDDGYAIVPTRGSGYAWDVAFNPLEVEMPAPSPAWLWPAVKPEPKPSKPVKPATGLSRYAAAALDSASRRIRTAGNDHQEETLYAESFSIGQLIAARAIPEGFARKVLLWAAGQMIDYEPSRPWRTKEIEAKIDRGFANAAARPRGGRAHG